LQILLPAYRFNIGFQRTKSCIAEVVPALLTMFNTWNKMSENVKYRTICEKLICYFRNKFEYEIESSIYSVTALLNTSKLRIWYNRKFSEENVTIATNELVNVASTFIQTDSQEKVAKKQTITHKHVDSDQEDDDLMFGLFQDDSDDDSSHSKSNLSNTQLLKNEKEIFLSLLSKEEETKKTSKNFWNDNKKKLPNLFKVAQFGFSVPASSAFIERFFSVCGVVCKKRCGNMSDDFIVKRSFLKCHMDILNELSNS